MIFLSLFSFFFGWRGDGTASSALLRRKKGKAYQSTARIQDHDQNSSLPFSYLSIYLRVATRMLKKDRMAS